jgi:hypothetical protein
VVNVPRYAGDVHTQTIPQDADARRFIRTPRAYFFLGAAAAIAGLLPWMITGMRLPLQNLWASDTLPADMPLTLLPFSQYAVILIASMIVTGSLIAAVVVRIAGARVPTTGVRAVAIGVLLVQVIATVQSAVVTVGGLRTSSAAALYVLALVGGTVIAIALGLAVLLLVSRGRLPGALIAFSFAAVAAGDWLSAFITPFGTYEVGTVRGHLLDVAQWVPAVLVGLAIAWCGIASVGRAFAALTSLALLWVTPALITGITSAAGTRVLTPYPLEMADYAVQVFFLALVQPGWSPRLVPVAVIIALVALGVRWMLRRRLPAS